MIPERISANLLVRIAFPFRIAVCALFLFTAAAGLRAQEVQPGEVIKIDANLVSVPVIVSDRDGRYLPGLTQADFKILDNGSEQPITFFDNAEAPLNVVLMLDTSKSTTDALKDIKKAAKKFLDDLRPQDRAMVVTFDYAIKRLSTLTSNRKELEKAIKKAEIGDGVGTVLYDAVYDVIDHDLRPINGRKAIILLTDGEDAGSQLDAPDLLSYAAEADTMVYSIDFPSGFGGGRFGGRGGRGGGVFGGGGRGGGIFGGGFPRGGGGGGMGGGGGYPRQRQGGGNGPGGGGRGERKAEFAWEFLTRLSDTTGGRFYKSEKTDFDSTFSLIADELRHQYRLGFYPPVTADADAVHSLKVTVDRPDSAVRARGFYRPGKVK